MAVLVVAAAKETSRRQNQAPVPMTCTRAHATLAPANRPLEDDSKEKQRRTAMGWKPIAGAEFLRGMRHRCANKQVKTQLEIAKPSGSPRLQEKTNSQI